MAKTIEELKESINNTINQNGSGQITGQGLNILLNEMADVLSTMGGNSGGNGSGVETYRILTPATILNTESGQMVEISPEEQEHNAQMYQKILEKIQTGEFYNVYFNLNVDGQFIQGSPSLTMVLEEVGGEDGVKVITFLIIALIFNFEITLLPDGNLIITDLN